MKKVTAVITTHNRCELLKKAIKSVLEQTYIDNMEVLVVDDASDDGTKEYMESINVEKLKYIRISKEESKGGCYARNLGIKNATGEYIAFLDDDDEWYPEKTTKQVKILDENPDIGVVVCGMDVEYNMGKLFESNVQNEEKVQDFSKKILYRMPGPTSTLLIRKELLEQINGFDEKLRYWQDYDLMVRLCQICKVGFNNENLILYRVNIGDKNRITNGIDGWFETIDYINEKHKNLISKLDKEEMKKRQLLIYYDAVNKYTMKGNRKKKKEYLKKIYNETHSMKDFIKYVINLDKNDIRKFKMKHIK